MALGRDQNAQTGLSGTTFSLGLAVVERGQDRRMAFSWLRDVADGLTIAPTEVDRERGTILSEYRESLNPGSAMAKKTGEFMLPELLGPHRLPLGPLETIRSATADPIRAGWEIWYRPEDTILIVVSNASRSRRRSARSKPPSAPGRTRRRSRSSRTWAASTRLRGLSVDTETDPNVASQLQVCRAMDKDPPQVEGVAFHMRDLENDIWTEVLKERLTRLSETADPPFIAAEVGRNEIFDQAAMACVSLGVRGQDWRSAGKGANAEIRRLELYGITPEEMETVRAALHANLEASLAGGDKMAQKARADLMLDNFLHDGTIDSVEEDYRVVSTALSRITPERVFGEFHRVWSQSNGPVLMLISSEAVTPDELRTAWQDADAAPKPAAPAAQATHPWAYTDFGKPGVVAHRQMLDDVAASRIEFANGVRVNFKWVDNIQDKVFIRVRFGAGQEEIPTSKSFTATMGSLLLRSGGLGKNDFQDTVQLCQVHSCAVDLNLGRDAFVLEARTRVSDLDTQLQPRPPS